MSPRLDSAVPGWVMFSGRQGHHLHFVAAWAIGCSSSCTFEFLISGF